MGWRSSKNIHSTSILNQQCRHSQLTLTHHALVSIANGTPQENLIKISNTHIITRTNFYGQDISEYYF